MQLLCDSIVLFLKVARMRSLSFRLIRSQMLAKSQPNLLDIGNDNDSDIYDGSNSLRSGTSSNTLNEDEIEREHKGKHKVRYIVRRELC